MLPVLLAYAGYFGGWFQHYTRSNRGELLEPFPPISSWQWQQADGQPFATGGKWWLVYVHGDGSCGTHCKLQLYTLQQTWIGIGKEQDRVRTGVLGTFDGELPAQSVVLRADAELLKQNGVVMPAYYIIDPNGNVVAKPGETWASSKKVEGIVRGNVPIDSRTTLYSRCGDWLPLIGWVVIGGGFILGFVRRRKAA